MSYITAGKKLENQPTKRSKRTDAEGNTIPKQRSNNKKATKRLKKAAKQANTPLKQFAKETNLPEGKQWLQRKKPTK
jgi:hypothetical protein